MAEVQEFEDQLAEAREVTKSLHETLKDLNSLISAMDLTVHDILSAKPKREGKNHA